MAPPPFSVIDLFAGPGGLGEGFSAFRAKGRQKFEIAVSIEKEESAARTLRFRAFMRLARRQRVELDLRSFQPASKTGVRDWLEGQSKDVHRLWRESGTEAWQVALGETEGLEHEIESVLSKIPGERIVIGGPPCQAYSLVGRARNRGIDGYVPEEDQRHFLYEEYIKILKRVHPVAFVMENVKGILSARVRKAGVFASIERDLRAAGYELFPLAPRSQMPIDLGDEGLRDPRDFVVRSEEFGIPQARHRVIVVGIHTDRAQELRERYDAPVGRLLVDAFGAPGEPVPVETVLQGLPPLHSTLSRRGRSDEDDWKSVVRAHASMLEADAGVRETVEAAGGEHGEFLAELRRVVEILGPKPVGELPEPPGSPDARCLHDWLTSNWSGPVKNHEPRGHMKEDLGRYLFASAWAKATGVSPKQPDFPAALAPDHANWSTGKFADRFRVQVTGAPATTVTSHISKDGHYFIHPDPGQCRSLTVREAARIQTFPDDYIFLGNRTQQYVQVGNAVPPLLARRIAGALNRVLDRG
ncbi:DNA cytosine methyltransferase [Gaopeijia maritima]|uniref:DNA cytosine methyltransferase n=1 Tax=Gaopeijia maritima TaxID=3119007 RepID=UPI00386FB84A